MIRGVLAGRSLAAGGSDGQNGCHRPCARPSNVALANLPTPGDKQVNSKVLLFRFGKSHTVADLPLGDSSPDDSALYLQRAPRRLQREAQRAAGYHLDRELRHQSPGADVSRLPVNRFPGDLRCSTDNRQRHREARMPSLPEGVAGSAQVVSVHSVGPSSAGRLEGGEDGQFLCVSYKGEGNSDKCRSRRWRRICGAANSASCLQRQNNPGAGRTYAGCWASYPPGPVLLQDDELPGAEVKLDAKRAFRGPPHRDTAGIAIEEAHHIARPVK